MPKNRPDKPARFSEIAARLRSALGGDKDGKVRAAFEACCTEKKHEDSGITVKSRFDWLKFLGGLPEKVHAVAGAAQLAHEEECSYRGARWSDQEACNVLRVLLFPETAK